jgi:hypothetical protein
MKSEMLRLLAIYPALPEYRVGIIPNFELKIKKIISHRGHRAHRKE